jgi:hypothetical protein
VAKKLNQVERELEARGEVRRVKDAAGNFILRDGDFIWELGQKIALAEWEGDTGH